jgi:hypothetical protein
VANEFGVLAWRAVQLEVVFWRASADGTADAVVVTLCRPHEDASANRKRDGEQHPRCDVDREYPGIVHSRSSLPAGTATEGRGILSFFILLSLFLFVGDDVRR